MKCSHCDKSGVKNGNSKTTITLGSMITSVTTALTNATSLPDPSGLKSAGASNALNTFGDGSNQGDTAPAAFLNYILFDLNYKVIDAGWKPITTGAFAT
jgi:hypothetical protein